MRIQFRLVCQGNRSIDVIIDLSKYVLELMTFQLIQYNQVYLVNAKTNLTFIIIIVFKTYSQNIFYIIHLSIKFL